MSHRVVELHCIMPIENLASVYRYGILSHDRAGLLPHASVAKQEIQDRRAGKTVPNGLRLHQYANLYFCARNPMLLLRKPEHGDICVIRLSTTVLNEPGVVISDQNASADYVRFYRYPEGMRYINFDYVFAEYWTDPDRITFFRKKATKCAEALVPNKVDPKFITGFYVCNEAAKEKVKTELAPLKWKVGITVDSHLFFR